jgi:hypothetical protein
MTWVVLSGIILIIKEGNKDKFLSAGYSGRFKMKGELETGAVIPTVAVGVGEDVKGICEGVPGISEGMPGICVGKPGI